MTIYDFKVLNQQGEEVSLKNYEGKVLLIVNTATKCGFTPQYDSLENMYEELKEQGFEILDFPCNQFFGQAPGTDEEINRAVNEAKEHEAEDKKLREKIDVKNEAEGVIFNTRKSLKEHSDKLTDEEKSKVETAVNDLEEYIKTEHNVEDLKKKIQETLEASYIIGQKMYENINQQGGAGSVPPGFEEMFKNAQQQYGQQQQTPPEADYEVVN